MTAPEEFDVIVVGAGHNGLVAACYLARAGIFPGRGRGYCPACALVRLVMTASSRFSRGWESGRKI